MPRPSAADYADAAAAAVRDNPPARLALLRETYRAPINFGRGHAPYLRAAAAFMGWQLRRGLLNPPNDPQPGSPWWRAVNERLLRDTAEARALALGYPGEPTTMGVATHLQFIRRPNPPNWYRAHNTSIVEGYLAATSLAADECRAERFFLNVVLFRVLFAHALVSAPRLALGWLAPLGRPLGDPRLGVVGAFLSLSRVLPDRYPLDGALEDYIAAEHGFGRVLDVGVIQPRLEGLYRWSADELRIPALRGLLDGTSPGYSWDSSDGAAWQIAPSTLTRVTRRAVPDR